LKSKDGASIDLSPHSSVANPNQGWVSQVHSCGITRSAKGRIDALLAKSPRWDGSDWDGSDWDGSDWMALAEFGLAERALAESL
jgi:hypothetical protein